MEPIFNMAFSWHLFLEALAFVRNFKMQYFLQNLEDQSQKKKKYKIFLPQNKFKMVAKFKMATKTKFSCINYKSSFFKNEI
jgi:hypothetical protein